MFVKRVQLKRFKQFTELTASLKHGLSLVVGGNNSGKSSILQGLAVWQFCTTLLEIEKGRKALVTTEKNQGIGMGIGDFTPINIPSLVHLWTNLKSQKKDEIDGYTLKVKLAWDNAEGLEKYLEIGLSLANDRLFVKTTETNLSLTEIAHPNGDPISGALPRLAYLPPFAGITDREGRLTPAVRNRLIGQGLSGSVIRNALFDLYETNRQERVRLKGTLPKIKGSDLKQLRTNDSWEILQKTIQGLFGTELRVSNFNERYHSYLNVQCAKGLLNKNTFTKHKNYQPRDLMVEGSGFLQWISVYALALSPDVDVLLLDEPDAHLNAALQIDLVGQLRNIAEKRGTQVLLASHSTELIRTYDHEMVLSVRDRKAKYLSNEIDKVGIIAGIGGMHTPTLHSLIRHKRLLILEGESDERLLKILAVRSGVSWPANVVSWIWTGKASERRQLFMQLRKDIPELRAISIRDRDDEGDGTVDRDLVDKSFQSREAGFSALKWRRRHIENYLLCIPAIARATQRLEGDITTYFNQQGLAIPTPSTASDVLIAIRDARGKELLKENDQSLEKLFGVTRDQIAEAMEPQEIAEDLETFFDALQSLSAVTPPA